MLFGIFFLAFIYLWSIIFLLITTLIGIFKKEKDDKLELDHVKISVFQNYKLLWDILKKPKIKLLAIALLTARVNIIQLFKMLLRFL